MGSTPSKPPRPQAPGLATITPGDHRRTHPHPPSDLLGCSEIDLVAQELISFLQRTRWMGEERDGTLRNEVERRGTRWMGEERDRRPPSRPGPGPGPGHDHARRSPSYAPPTRLAISWFVSPSAASSVIRPAGQGQEQDDWPQPNDPTHATVEKPTTRTTTSNDMFSRRGVHTADMSGTHAQPARRKRRDSGKPGGVAVGNQRPCPPCGHDHGPQPTTKPAGLTRRGHPRPPACAEA